MLSHCKPTRKVTFHLEDVLIFRIFGSETLVESEHFVLECEDLVALHVSEF